MRTVRAAIGALGKSVLSEHRAKYAGLKSCPHWLTQWASSTANETRLPSRCASCCNSVDDGVCSQLSLPEQRVGVTIKAVRSPSSCRLSGVVYSRRKYVSS
jgi:hypothetical protein